MKPIRERTGNTPPRTLRLALALAVLVTVGASGSVARATPIKKLMQIRVGEQGYCLTVFKGVKPERFRFKVTGILFNYFPRQHLILIESSDPKLKLAGVVAGMSGSPCFVGGKLAGALAYGPNWSKKPIAMLTPIQYMLDELKRPLRGMKRSPLARLRKRQPRPRLAWKDPKNPLSPWYKDLPAPRAALVRRKVAGMRRLSVPLSVSGLDARTLKEFKKAMSPYGFQVVQGGGGGSADALKYYRAPRKFVAGGSIGVQLMRGAVSMNGTGTVTYVKGSKVLAFGHPMANYGEHYVPVTSSWIHMFVPSYASSYKVSTALRELGSLVMDRRPCIIADTSKRAPMIPVSVKVTTPNDGRKNYDFQVFSNRFATPFYLSYALRSILRKVAPDVTDTSLAARFSFTTQRAGTFSLNDYLFTGMGAGRGFRIYALRGYQMLRFLMRTTLKRVRLKSVRIDVSVEHKAKIADIDDVRLGSTNVAPGDRVSLLVKFKRRFGRGSFTKTVPVTIPRHIPNGTLIRIHVASGPLAPIDMVPPESLADVKRIMRRMHHARQLVVRVLTPGEGTSVHGRLVSHLPGSVLDTLRSGTSAKTRMVHRSSARRVINLSDVISGSKYLYIRVRQPQGS